MPPAMFRTPPRYTVSLSRDPEDIRAAQALRHEVFVKELGAPDHTHGVEADRFDEHCLHLLLRDEDQVVGTYRLLDGDGAAAAGGYYTETEYDIAPLRESGASLLELGRSCVRSDHRGGTALAEMWAALARHVAKTGAGILFGVASFHGTRTEPIAQPLAYLAANHLAPLRIRPVSRAHVPMDVLGPDAIDRVAAVKALPALVKAYLRLGGCVGDGAFVDHAFNTVDTCLVLDVRRIPASSRARNGWPSP